MNKKELEIKLSKLKGLHNPKVELEQYQTPSNIAADILWNAFLRGDIEGKVIGDFGCGNGIFGVGALLLGAEKVIFLDIDSDALAVAKLNASAFSNVEFINDDVSNAPFLDTCFSNPPFGIQSKMSTFVDNIIGKAGVCYLLLPAGRKVDGELVGRYNYKLPRTFGFHKKKFYEFNVEVFRIEKFK